MAAFPARANTHAVGLDNLLIKKQTESGTTHRYDRLFLVKFGHVLKFCLVSLKKSVAHFLSI